MPPASFVRPGISSGDVWTLSIATEKLMSTPLLQLLVTLIADAWPAPFVCFLLAYEHLFTPFNTSLQLGLSGDEKYLFFFITLLARTKYDAPSISQRSERGSPRMHAGEQPPFLFRWMGWRDLHTALLSGSYSRRCGE